MSTCKPLGDNGREGILFGNITIGEAAKGLLFVPPKGRYQITKQFDPAAAWLREIISCWEGEPDTPLRRLRWQIVFDFSHGLSTGFDRISSTSRTEKDHSSGRTSYRTSSQTHYLVVSGFDFTLKVREAEAAADLRWAIDESLAAFIAASEMKYEDPGSEACREDDIPF